MLLCDRCDNGYHMDCLDPPLEAVPIEDWFCPRCDGSEVTTAQGARRRAPLTWRVRRTVQRNRQRVLRDSSIGKKMTTRKSNKKRKTPTKRRKRKGKTRRRKAKKKAGRIPSTPRKRLACALGIQDQFTLPVAPPAQFTLFGDSNALDSPR